MKFSARYRLASLFLIFLVVVGYGYVSKSNVDNFFGQSDSELLIKMPETEILLLNENIQKKIAQVALLGDSLSVVHFWGTWCAPCGVEFPSLLKIAENFKNSKIKFILVAVNDQREDVLKYLKRFKIPENVVIAIDRDGNAMSRFGSVKVPETYIFNAEGINLKRYVGPQEWDNPVYLSQLTAFMK